MKVFWGIKMINWLDSYIKNVKDQTIGKVNALWRKCRIYQVSLHFSKQEQYFRSKYLNSVYTNLYLVIHILRLY